MPQNFTRDRTNIIGSRILPFHAIEIIAGTGAEDMHVLIRTMGTGSVWSLQEVRKKNRVVAYSMTAKARVIYNDYRSEDYEKTLERLSFQGVQEVILHLKALPGQANGGSLLIKNELATIQKFQMRYGWPEQGDTKWPDLEINVSGWYSVDAVKGFGAAYDIDATTRQFFHVPV